MIAWAISHPIMAWLVYGHWRKRKVLSVTLVEKNQWLPFFIILTASKRQRRRKKSHWEALGYIFRLENSWPTFYSAPTESIIDSDLEKIVVKPDTSAAASTAIPSCFQHLLPWFNELFTKKYTLNYWRYRQVSGRDKTKEQLMVVCLLTDITSTYQIAKGRENWRHEIAH